MEKCLGFTDVKKTDNVVPGAGFAGLGALLLAVRVALHPELVAGELGRKLLSCSQVKGWVKQPTWLLIGDLVSGSQSGAFGSLLTKLLTWTTT